jgi:Rha family phage regulatory protein
MNIEQKAITSIEVAEMVGKEHSDLMKDIRRYLTQLGEGKISPTDFFTDGTYRSEQNKELPCYLVTKKGCEFIGNKLTGTKGTVFTAKYINRFNDMETAIVTQMQNLSPELQMFQSLFNAVAQQEIRNKQIEQKMDKVIETQQMIKETFVEPIDSWRVDIKHKISTIQREMSLSYQDTYGRIYDDLEKRAHCDLSLRVCNGRRRLEGGGAKKTQIDGYCRIDVIEADPKLKEIFTTIVKEYLMKYAA